jgi:hypothetical protein
MRQFGKSDRKRQFNGFAIEPKVTFPLEDGYIIVHSRQSREEYYGNVSTEIQTQHMVTQARQLCVNPDKQVILVDENTEEDGTVRSVSGTWGAEKRHGLTRIYDLVARGMRDPEHRVRVIMPFLENRQFRDETAELYNEYIQIMKKAGVVTMVYASGKIYDFDNPYDVKMYRSRCEAASDELTTIKTRLLGAREYMAEKGQYANLGSLATGFIRNPTTDKADPLYRKPIEYTPWADVVRWLFARYYEIGDDYKLFCEIENKPIFPLLPEGVKIMHSLGRKKPYKDQFDQSEGYCLTQTGIVSMLTNPMYIGYWFNPFTGTFIKNNHPAIVPEEHFWYAFKRLSKYNLDGTPNPECVIKQYRRRREEKPEDTTLLTDVIEGPRQGTTVYPTPKKNDWYYQLNDYNDGIRRKWTLVIPSHEIDDFYLERLREKLNNAKELETFRQFEKKRLAKLAEETQGRQAQLEAVEAQMKEIEEKIEKLKNLTLIGKLEEKYAKLEKRKSMLESAPIPGMQGKPNRRLNRRLNYYEILERLGPKLERLNLEQKRILVEATTEEVVIDHLAPHFIYMKIVWRGWGIAEYVVQRANYSGKRWSTEEEDILRQHYSLGSAEEIMQLIPNKSWNCIKDKACSMGLSRDSFHLSAPKYERKEYGLNDLKIMEQYGIQPRDRYKVIATGMFNSDNPLLY